MNQFTNPYESGMLYELPEETRAGFIRKTYGHLAGAIALFVLLETVFFALGLERMALAVLGAGSLSWLLVLGVFMAVSWVAERWANNGASLGKQYAGLALYTLAEAIIFLPLLALAVAMTGDGSLLIKAAMITGAMVLGISAVALTTRKDFSFLGGILKVGGIVALGLIVVSCIFPVTLGLWFSGLMVVFASGAVLYNTSNLIHRYSPGQHVAASLSLFASVALLFWYVLQIVMRFGRD